MTSANAATTTDRAAAWISAPFPQPAPSAAAKQYSLPPHLVLADGTPDYLRLILSADVYDLVKTTPLHVASNLGARLGCDVFMKREDLQPVFSFKLRGAFNMMRGLQGEAKWKGVIACSAGELDAAYLHDAQDEAHFVSLSSTRQVITLKV